jgi:beta-glucanase (GH16 family)
MSTHTIQCPSGRASRLARTAVAMATVLLTACSALPPAPLAVASNPAQTLAPPAGYQLVWADEFECDGLPDPTRWAYDTGMNKAGWHNRELQYYAGPRAENAVVRGGRLVITARRESLSTAPDWGGQRYTSTRLFTHGRRDWTYGFFEVRAKLPCGLGTWPAIWLLNSAMDWPAGGELDIMEHVGKNPGHVFSSIHTAANHGGNPVGGGTTLKDACSRFHDYQMHWTADRLRFAIDGKVHLEYVNPRAGRERWPFDTPQFLILNIAVGGDLGGPVDDSVFPVAMEVEHVRVYQARP